MNYDMYILSAKHGLLEAEKIIAPYDRKMTEERSNELIPYVKKMVDKYDVIVYFKGGSSKLYSECIKKSCSDVILVSFGSRIMQGIHDLPKIINLCNEEKFSDINYMSNVTVDY